MQSCYQNQKNLGLGETIEVAAPLRIDQTGLLAGAETGTKSPLHLESPKPLHQPTQQPRASGPMNLEMCVPDQDHNDFVPERSGGGLMKHTKDVMKWGSGSERCCRTTKAAIMTLSRVDLLAGVELTPVTDRLTSESLSKGRVQSKRHLSSRPAVWAVLDRAAPLESAPFGACDTLRRVGTCRAQVTSRTQSKMVCV